MRAANGFRAGLRQAEEANLALLDQVFDNVGDLFHRHFGIDAVLVQEIDVIGPEPLKAALDCAH